MRCSASDGNLAVRGERVYAGCFPSLPFPILAPPPAAYMQVVAGNSKKKKKSASFTRGKQMRTLVKVNVKFSRNKSTLYDWRNELNARTTSSE